MISDLHHMKAIRIALVVLTAIGIALSFSEASKFPSLSRDLAESDIVGMGSYAGYDSLSRCYRIDNATYWLGDPGTNSVLIGAGHRESGFSYRTADVPGDQMIFFGNRLGWRQSPSNFVFRARPFSSWEWREKLMQAGSAGQVPSPPFKLYGDWINVETNSPAVVAFVSNVVHSLCVSPDLIRYSQSLIPPLNVEAEGELFEFKGDAHMDLMKLEWGEGEEFLEHVLNSPLYPRRFRGSALFQLKKRFDWPTTNTVPEP